MKTNRGISFRTMWASALGLIFLSVPAFGQHAVVGTWDYSHRGKSYQREFTANGKCTLYRSDRSAMWTYDYKIINPTTVDVWVPRTRKWLRHTIQSDGSLRIENKYTATRIFSLNQHAILGTWHYPVGRGTYRREFSANGKCTLYRPDHSTAWTYDYKIINPTTVDVWVPRTRKWLRHVIQSDGSLRIENKYTATKAVSGVTLSSPNNSGLNHTSGGETTFTASCGSGSSPSNAIDQCSGACERILCEPDGQTWDKKTKYTCRCI